MKKIKIYTTEFCPYCQAAKGLLEEKKLSFESINLETDPKLREKLSQENNHYTVPMIFIDDIFLGGFSELQSLAQSGGLDEA